MVPAFRSDGWLPEGHHQATWSEIRELFGGPPESVRGILVVRLLEWIDELKESGLGGFLILDGSFISSKQEPGDIDCILVLNLASEKIIKSNDKARDLTDYLKCKERGIGDVFGFLESTVQKHPTFCRLDGYDFDRSGVPKGVIEVQI
jgi:hypothetical protein